MIKLPQKKSVPKHNNELKEYAKGWNKIIKDTKYLYIHNGIDNAKKHLLKVKKSIYEKVTATLPYDEGRYDCIVEIEKLNKEDNREEEEKWKH